MKIALQFMRYHRPSWAECGSIEDAVGMAWGMEEYETGVPHAVVSLDGEVLLDEHALREAVDAYGDAQPEPVFHTPKEIPAEDMHAATAFSKFMGASEARPSDWEQLDEETRAIWRAKVEAS
jgi:hypothetical protein